MFCSYCGAEVTSTHNFCETCGTLLNDTELINTNDRATVKATNLKNENTCVNDVSVGSDSAQNTCSDIHVNYSISYGENHLLNSFIPKRSIVLAVFFSIITCGIYTLYWIYRINNETNLFSNNVHATSGGIVLLLTIFTFGIYGWYWHFIMGTRLDQACEAYGHPFGERGLIYLLISIFTFGIISMCLEQRTLNTLVDTIA